jgi:hypothetical protein
MYMAGFSLNKLSLMYYAIRQHLEENLPPDTVPGDVDSQAETHNGERYTAHKCKYQGAQGQTCPAF